LLLDRRAGRLSVPVSAPVEEIATALQSVEKLIRRRREAEAIQRLDESAGAGQAGVSGPDATLQALSDRRVSVLLVAEGFAGPGSRCPTCGYLGVNVWQCARCGARPAALDDVVEPAVAEAVTEQAQVRFVRPGRLDRFGKIGALLRF
jgi:peptide subunit release factor 1 (eRF1)